ncbi:MAG: DUF1501 domain-containing protein, partial [Verrucomicrobiia bacterium]
NLIDGHQKNAAAVDQPIAGLIKDLKSRGLFDDTLLVFSGEFGRTPFAQGTNGRDHNPQGFSMWMAGGGIKGGMTYGATDDHTRLTYRYSGRDVRLTDVHGEIIPELFS